MKSSRIRLALFLLPLLLGSVGVGAGAGAFAAPIPESELLKDGTPIEVTLPLGRAVWTGRVEVPEEAVALGVFASADRDVDLYLRFGQPAEEDYPSTADVAAFTESPHEVVTLSVLGSVRLRPGTWYVTVENPFPRERGLSFEVGAFVDRVGGRRTVLPGEPAAVTVPGPGRNTVMRTWVPQRASRAIVDLQPPLAGGLRFSIEGPTAFLRRGTARERVVLDREDAPPGAYTVGLSTPTRQARAPRITARMTWEFTDGTVLPIPPSPRLAAGVPLPLVMGGPKNGNAQQLRIEVPEGRRGFVLESSSSLRADVDLFVRRGAAPRSKDEDAEWLGLSAGPRERVVVGGSDPLSPGTYHAEVVLVDDQEPVEVVLTLSFFDGEDGPFTWGTADPPPLVPGEWTEGRVRVFDSAIHWHAVDLPEGTNSLHAQLVESTGPLELLVARRVDGEILGRAFTPLVDERLQLDFASPLPSDQRFYLGVLNRATWDPKVGYRLAFGIDGPPELPADFPWPPSLRRDDLTPPERAAAATVEITIGDCSGGSGVCVSPGGLIVSCRHCLQLTDGLAGVQRDGIIVAFPQDLDTPPVQAFYARIVGEDADLDLVLLEPVRDVFGRPLPTGVRMPWLPLGDDVALRLGEPLWVTGYPQVGSECARTAVVLSRGIVAGLEREAGGATWIKTDAWMAPGHSGGPVVGPRGRLVGIAAATLGTTESLGLAIPIQRLPEAWRHQIRQAVEVAAPAASD